MRKKHDGWCLWLPGKGLISWCYAPTKEEAVTEACAQYYIHYQEFLDIQRTWHHLVADGAKLVKVRLQEVKG